MDGLREFDKKTEKKKLPKIFLVLRVVAFALLGVGIALLSISFTINVPAMGDAGWMDANIQQNGFRFGGIACLMFGVFLMIGSFMPAISKTMIKTQNYIINDNKDTLTDTADAIGDIGGGMVEKLGRSLKNGMSDEAHPTTQTSSQRRTRKAAFCSSCGTKLQAGDAFCSSCGTKID